MIAAGVKHLLELATVKTLNDDFTTAGLGVVKMLLVTARLTLLKNIICYLLVYVIVYVSLVNEVNLY